MGVEPATCSLRVSCSTTELLWRSMIIYIIKEDIARGSDDFNLNLQESPPSKQSERRRGMEERSSDVMRLQYEEMGG